ncbi:FtsB family cell division protein [Paenibacillus sp. FA6]|uniref:FtsB family cell division protein n=1 Tax=Paenibacillus sp. FA6 TaxID=3413029 RepID=UPI003F658EA6
MSKYASQTSRSQQSTKYAGGRRRLVIWMCFMIFFLGWAGYTLMNQRSQIADINMELVKKERTQAESDQSVLQLEYEVNRLQDPEYIGQLARKDYGLYRPEETPIRPDVSSP